MKVSFLPFLQQRIYIPTDVLLSLVVPVLYLNALCSCPFRTVIDSQLFSKENGENGDACETESMKEFHVASLGAESADDEPNDEQGSSKNRGSVSEVRPTDPAVVDVPEHRPSVRVFSVLWCASDVYHPDALQRSRKRLKRMSTRTTLLSNKNHSVFCPEDLPVDVGSRSSSGKSLGIVRHCAARETFQNRQQMTTSLKKFSRMQKSLETNDGNLEAMDHDVPLKKLYRRISREQLGPRVSSKGQTTLNTVEETGCD